MILHWRLMGPSAFDNDNSKCPLARIQFAFLFCIKKDTERASIRKYTA